MADKVLIVDDDPSICRLLEKVMHSNELETTVADSGLAALNLLKNHSYDMILMDITLGDMEGFDVIKKLRSQGIQTPVMIISGRNEDYDSLYGLSLGADDYITKPFVPMEVLARVRSQLRRYTLLGGQAPEKPSVLTIGGICLDDEAKTVTVDGEPANLTPMEFSILRLLMSNPGKVYSSRSLYEAVWNEAPLGSEGAVAVHIRHLREKIEINPSEPRYLKVVWGQGYKMEGGKP